MADSEKKQLSVPDLPQIVQGDGRYVMSLLRRYLRELVNQVNLSNGFEAEPAKQTLSGIAGPPSFILRFGVDGGILDWNVPPYSNIVKQYEIRTNSRVGQKYGLLEHTRATTSKALPFRAEGTIYLFAILNDGTVTNPSIIHYAKPRPLKPEKISVVKTKNGIMIVFTTIPIDCIGAHIYIDGERFSSEIEEFLYKGDSDRIYEIKVAYYDQFGDGQAGYIYNNVPDVNGFIVERNGAVLDFYWEPLDMHGAGYAVQVAKTPVWGSGVELFTTKLNKKKFEYPNTGEYYFLIKAYDEHGNWSKNATWYRLITAKDPTRNIIIDFDQDEVDYPGNKVNMYYDPTIDGLRISDGSYSGEYIFNGELSREFKARNWASFDVNNISESSLRVIDCNFPVASARASVTTITGGNIGSNDCAEVKTYIAKYKGKTFDENIIVELNGQLDTAAGKLPTEKQHCTAYDYGRWGKGLVINELTRLSYGYETKARTFSSVFSVKIKSALDVCTIAVWSGRNGWLELGYDGNTFYLNGSDGKRLNVLSDISVLDYVTFGVSQTETERSLFIKELDNINSDEIQYMTEQAPPIGVMSSIRFYRGELQ